jgi:predicted unusual protein kinase regulating ubiquinone biosynthesis (AarF/ABC1/UbiB family)
VKNLSEKENAKRLPISSLARTTLSAGLLLRLGVNTSQSLMSDLISVKKPDLKSALISKKNVIATVDTLKNLRGAAMKFGQLLSLDETCNSFARVGSNIRTATIIWIFYDT